MRKIEVILSPKCVEGVSKALREAKISRFFASDVRAYDGGAILEGSYRGARYAIAPDRVKLEVVVPDQDLAPALQAIREGVEGSLNGEAELFVLAVEDSLRLGAPPSPRPRASH